MMASAVLVVDHVVLRRISTLPRSKKLALFSCLNEENARVVLEKDEQLYLVGLILSVMQSCHWIKASL